MSRNRPILQVYDYYAGGADTESTVRDNRAVYGRYRLLPRYMVDVSHVDLTYTLLGNTTTDCCGGRATSVTSEGVAWPLTEVLMQGRS